MAVYILFKLRQNYQIIGDITKSSEFLKHIFLLFSG